MKDIRTTTLFRPQKYLIGVSAWLTFVAAILPGCVRPSQQIQSVEYPQDRNDNSSLSAELQSAIPEDSKEITIKEQHEVILGETLNTIAEQYDVSTEAIMAINKIKDGSQLFPGRVLLIPSPGDLGNSAINTTDKQDEPAQPVDTEIITDQHLVYGPAAKDFDTVQFLQAYDGYLLEYQEEVEDQLLDGSEIVQLVADRHSVNPRLLLAILEYNSGWLTQQEPQKIEYVLGREEAGREGLYKQLSWTANLLNLGFYGRSEGGLKAVLVGETEVLFASGISDGTAGVQNYLASRDDITFRQWESDAGPKGVAATYRQLFGDPLTDGEAPLLPDNLQQPPLQVPWEKGLTWYFSGGPHGGWNSGSAWAALDFAPPDVEYGCFTSESWTTAVADGVIARSGFGAVVLDLDSDGYPGTGWAITYMHLDNRDRIEEGTQVSSGDRLGHPGCEGGVTNGTHLHLARTFNGRWISADGAIPFDLSGWISGGEGYEYNGWLERDGIIKTADIYRTDDNAITAD
jgi:LasA protease